MANYDEIKVFVETHYDLAIESVTPITHKSMKVRASNHDYLLKVASGDDDFIMKQLFAYKALSRNVLPIYRTKDNQHYVPWRDHFFYLTDYVQTIPLPLEQQIHYYIELLGKLHSETSLEVDVSDDELQRSYNKDYKRLQDSYDCLQKNMEVYELQRDRSPFEWYFMMVYPMLYTMLHHAHDELKKFYDLIKREKKLPISLIHGDVNVANLLVTEKSTYLINFEKSMFSISSLDMYYFLENYHQVPGLHSIILDYVKNEKAAALRHYFFFRSLCIDLDELNQTLQDHSLINIALLNECIAPHLMALQVYNQFNKPTTTNQASPQGSST